MKHFILFLTAILTCFTVFAQDTDADDDDEDYSLYDTFESVDDKKVKIYASPRIVGASPQRFVTVGWDAQLPYTMEFSEIGVFAVDEDAPVSERANARYTGGFRFNSNIPVISKNSFVWQTGLNFMDTRYKITDYEDVDGYAAGLSAQLADRGLRNISWVNTFYVPLNQKSFLLFQTQIDLSGDFGFRFQPAKTLRYSGAAIYGQRPHDRLQWGVGLARTYRVGNMNYVPVVMYNWTSQNRKWGTEILFPARVLGRFNFDQNNLLLFGVELEGQSYRIDAFSQNGNSFEIRRGEMRPKIEFQKKLFGFFWGHIQAGYRINYSYDADELINGKDFFRGLFGNQPFAMKNSIGNAMYFNVGISFVSP
jgi:hypothetical protein